MRRRQIGVQRYSQSRSLRKRPLTFRHAHRRLALHHLRLQRGVELQIVFSTNTRDQHAVARRIQALIHVNVRRQTKLPDLAVANVFRRDVHASQLHDLLRAIRTHIRLPHRGVVQREPLQVHLRGRARLLLLRLRFLGRLLFRSLRDGIEITLPVRRRDKIHHRRFQRHFAHVDVPLDDVHEAVAQTDFLRAD